MYAVAHKEFGMQFGLTQFVAGGGTGTVDPSQKGKWITTNDLQEAEALRDQANATSSKRKFTVIKIEEAS